MGSRLPFVPPAWSNGGVFAVQFSLKIIQGFAGFFGVHGLINPAQVFGTSFLWYSEKTELVPRESEAILTDKAISAIATKLVLTTQSQKYAVEIGNV